MKRCQSLILLILSVPSSQIVAVQSLQARMEIHGNADTNLVIDSTHTNLDIMSPVAQASQIPRQLILTGKPESLHELPETVRRNIDKTLARNPTLKVRWLGDNACHNFLKQHQEVGLLQAFEAEKRGSYRGDLCRSAVLAVEGGYYQDIDVDLVKPFSELVEDSNFMSIFSKDGSILNAVIASAPKHPIMMQTVEALKKWYAVKAHKNWMGPATLHQGMQNFMQDVCPEMTFKKAALMLQWRCGPHTVRLFQERRLECKGAVPGSSPEISHVNGCTRTRKETKFDGLKYGFFMPGKTGAFVGWPRFEDCHSFGCEGGGWVVDKL